MNPEAQQEISLWQGTPSQWTNFGTYLVCLLLAVGIVALYFVLPAAQSTPLIFAGLAVPALWATARWIATRCWRYEVTSERVKITTGLLSRHTSEIELYRVRDYSVVEPFWLRLVGCGHVVLVTSDRTNPHIELRAIPDATVLKDQIRTYTERQRKLRGVRDLEVDSPPSGE